MKLLNYTNNKLSLLLFFLIIVWGVFFFSAMHHEITDETDDMLRSYRDIFVKKALHNPELLNSSYETTFDRYYIRCITEEEAEKYEDQWYDTEVYFPEGNEHIPVRVFKSIFLTANDQYYELEINMSTVERNDMLETLLMFLLILYCSLVICIIIGNRIILKKSFAPLDKLLLWLNNVTPGRPVPPLNNDTKIKEFQKLNEATTSMAKRNYEVYEHQKQFIENASHELQTPLAIALNKIELFTKNEQLSEKQLAEIEEIYWALNRTVRLNKSLLLLTRIENEQFQDKTNINVNKTISELSEDMKEIYEYKNLKFTLNHEADCNILLNEILVQMLFSNLLKNAFIHTNPEGQISVTIKKNELIIKNSGNKPLDSEKIFERFYHSSDNPAQTLSSGMGLAIVKSIAKSNMISIAYHFDDAHIFMLKFAN